MSAAREQKTELTLITDDNLRAQIADLVEEDDRIQFSNSRFRRELASWVHSRRAKRGDGMSGDGFGMPDVLSGVGALVIRTFDLGKGVANGWILTGSPVLSAFSSRATYPKAILPQSSNPIA